MPIEINIIRFVGEAEQSAKRHGKLIEKWNEIMDMPEISNQLKPRQIERFKTKLEKQANRMMEQHLAFAVSFLDVKFFLKLKRIPILVQFISSFRPILPPLSILSNFFWLE